MYRQSEKNLLSSNISSTCPHNMVNFGPLATEIVSLVWGTPGTFNGFRVLAALLHGTLAVGVSQIAALNRGRRLYSAGRPSRWALAHISSYDLIWCVGRPRPDMRINMTSTRSKVKVTEPPKLRKLHLSRSISSAVLAWRSKLMVDGDSMGPVVQPIGARFWNFLLGKLSREFKLRGMSAFHETHVSIFR